MNCQECNGQYDRTRRNVTDTCRHTKCKACMGNSATCRQCNPGGGGNTGDKSKGSGDKDKGSNGGSGGSGNKGGKA